MFGTKQKVNVTRHLDAELLLGVNTGGGGEGVVEQDERVGLHVEGQVGAGDETEARDRTDDLSRTCVSNCAKPCGDRGAQDDGHHAVHEPLREGLSGNDTRQTLRPKVTPLDGTNAQIRGLTSRRKLPESSSSVW